MQSPLGILAITETYEEVAASIPEDLKGSELVLKGYSWYETNYNTSAPRQRPINGKVFECLVIQALYQHDIRPVYHQAQVVNIPNVIYDILLFHPRHPVVLSCKTSLRERWKQADLEGLALKQVYRGAKSILLTMSKEGHSVQQNIGASNVMGLDQSIVIDGVSSDFDDLLDSLQSTRFTEVVNILPVRGTLIP